MSNRRDMLDRSKWSDVIRVIQPREAPLIAAHFFRLDTPSRQDRFGYTASDETLQGYAQRLVGERGLVAGCFPDGTLRGVIEARPANGESCYWEAVLSIEPDWQRQGLGLALTDFAFKAAKKTGASRVYLRCSVANATGQHFLARLARTLREEDGEAVATIDLSDPARVTGAMLRSLTSEARVPAQV